DTSVNHQIFERTLRSLVFLGACLFEYHEIIKINLLFTRLILFWTWGSADSRLLPLNALAGSL
ncbi:hypothetical protein, partial [Endobacterium cereale]|uniref:hypothetical protein n=1 Tax=Endobacterium cereale TaxID=2663029 RepID=UPI001AD94FD7